MSTRRVVIVTGAGTGIGQAAALRFAQEEFTVIANGRRLEKLNQTVELGAALPGRILPVAGDVAEPDTARMLTERAAAEGDYGWLVNNAGVGWSYGISHPGAMNGLRDTSLEHWREVLSINLESVYLLCHAALERFCEQGSGSVLNVASGGGLRGMDDAHTYATAKAGVINMTRSMARAYGRFGVRSNVVAPGFVDTEMVSPVLESALNPFPDPEGRFQVSPMGRPGRPEEVADAIFYLAVEASYCNGAVLIVDGGSLA